MNIKEAAEKYWPLMQGVDNGTPFLKAKREHYEACVTHYESLMRAEGYEWVKVDEAIRFAEWCGIDYNYSDEDRKWLARRQGDKGKSTSELYQIFKQQHP